MPAAEEGEGGIPAAARWREKTEAAWSRFPWEMKVAKVMSADDGVAHEEGRLVERLDVPRALDTARGGHGRSSDTAIA